MQNPKWLDVHFKFRVLISLFSMSLFKVCGTQASHVFAHDSGLYCVYKLTNALGFPFVFFENRMYE